MQCSRIGVLLVKWTGGEGTQNLALAGVQCVTVAGAGTMSATYSTAVEGGRQVSLRFRICGHFDTHSYLEFIAERAAWFSVRISAVFESGGIGLLASGPEAMVGALEMACTLGPIDALIASVEVVDVSSPADG